MRPGAARPRSRRSTGSRRRPSESRSGRKAPRGCSCGSAPISVRRKRPRESARTRRPWSSSGPSPGDGRRPSRGRGERCRCGTSPRRAGAACRARAPGCQSCGGTARRSAGRAPWDRERACGRRGGTGGATAALYRLGTARERIAMRSESGSALRDQLRLELAEAEAAAKRPGLVSGRARSGRQRGDRRSPYSRSCSRRPARACVAREGATRRARALARGTRGNSTGRAGAGRRGRRARALAPRRRLRQRACGGGGAHVARVRGHGRRRGGRAGTASARPRRGAREPGRADRQASGGARRRASGRPARRPALRHRRLGHRGRIRLRPPARRALVRR
jgi:hypothetical protein